MILRKQMKTKIETHLNFSPREESDDVSFRHDPRRWTHLGCTSRRRHQAWSASRRLLHAQCEAVGRVAKQPSLSSSQSSRTRGGTPDRSIHPRSSSNGNVENEPPLSEEESRGTRVGDNECSSTTALKSRDTHHSLAREYFNSVSI